MFAKTVAIVASAAVLSSVLTFLLSSSFMNDANAENAILVTENESIQSRLSELEHQLSERKDAPRRFVLQQDPAARRPKAVKDSQETPAAKSGQEAELVPAPEKAEDAGLDQAKKVKALMTSLADPNLSMDAKQALWRKLAAAGIADEVISQLMASSEKDPQNPDLAADLGSAYVAKLRGEGVTSLEKRDLTMKAMKQFDRALELDSEHWEARFSKSMMQVFAPAALGLQADAQVNLTTLIEQQRTQAKQPEHAHSYFFLANLYQNRGDAEKSMAIKEEAAGLFPQDTRFQ